ncbi:hypothetical protein BDZ45DRAFT_770381 [Acephala macrosclerotiorum]|nr:hypothetical protein BDZ45DRAFT_770381 [Acephala macrosclerotiorum]
MSIVMSSTEFHRPPLELNMALYDKRHCRPRRHLSLDRKGYDWLTAPTSFLISPSGCDSKQSAQENATCQGEKAWVSGDGHHRRRRRCPSRPGSKCRFTVKAQRNRNPEATGYDFRPASYSFDSTTSHRRVSSHDAEWLLIVTLFHMSILGAAHVVVSVVGIFGWQDAGIVLLDYFTYGGLLLFLLIYLSLPSSFSHFSLSYRRSSWKGELCTTSAFGDRLMRFAVPFGFGGCDGGVTMGGKTNAARRALHMKEGTCSQMAMKPSSGKQLDEC